MTPRPADSACLVHALGEAFEPSLRGNQPVAVSSLEQVIVGALLAEVDPKMAVMDCIRHRNEVCLA